MTWSPQTVDEKLERALDRQDELLADLLELAVLKDQCDAAYEVARRDAVNAGKAKGSNELERTSKLRAVQVRPGKTILDLRIERDKSRTAFNNVKLLIDKLEKQIDVLQTLHVTHRNASASGPRR